MTVWFISDTHFFHENMLKFLREDGSKIREFDDINHLHEVIVERWNDRIAPSDKVYHLGDVTFKYGEVFAGLMRRLNGKKRLILGNHDKLKGTNLINFFEKVELWRTFGDQGFFTSHVPIHRSNFPGKAVVQVHGHIHYKPVNSAEYINVSVEATDYWPISIDTIREKVSYVLQG